MGPCLRGLFLILPAVAALGVDAAPDPAAAPGRTWTDDPPAAAAQPALVTPATVQQAIQDAMRQDRGLWDDFDLDHDGRVSQLEVVACVAKRPRWLRSRFPALFAAIDTDHDGAISFAELEAFANRADTPLFTLIQRQPSLVGPDPTGALGGGAAGAGVEVGSGGVTASAAFMHQQAYIAGYDVVGGQYQPVIGVLAYGTVLNVGDVVITIVHQGP